MMRLIFSFLITMFMVNVGQAMAPINEGTLRQAQEYGKEGAVQSLQDFLQPWIVYEEKAPRLDVNAERACVYSPWLLVAADAREKAVAHHPIELSAAENVLSDYAGFLSVSVELRSRDARVFEGITAALKQGGKPFASYQITTPAAAGDPAGLARAGGLCYIYFKLEGLRIDRPAELTVTGGDGKMRRFFIDLGRIK